MEIVARAAERLGIAVEAVDREFGYLIELSRQDKKRVMFGSLSPLNSALSARLTADKFFTGLLLARSGFRVPRTVRCLSSYWSFVPEYEDRIGPKPGVELAAELGYPLIVKPNNLSRGRGITVVHDDTGLETAIEEVWQIDHLALVQEIVEGRDLRLDYLDGELLVGYERTPLRVRGDGRRSLAELLSRDDPRFLREDTLRRIASDPLWKLKVGDRGWTFSTVPPDGEELSFSYPVLNLQRLATAVLIDKVPEKIDRACVEIGETLGLRHFGVDLRVPSLASGKEDVVVLEVNHNPLLDHLFQLGHTELVLDCQVRLLRKAFPELDPDRHPTDN